MDLEGKMAAMQEELKNAPMRKVTSSVDWIPRPPEQWTLTGHRSPITRVAFHPVFTVVASASEDTTIRIWDYDSGDYERTLKGHTKAVQDIAFDAKGNFLGMMFGLGQFKVQYHGALAAYNNHHGRLTIDLHPLIDSFVLE